MKVKTINNGYRDPNKFVKYNISTLNSVRKAIKVGAAYTVTVYSWIHGFR